MALPIQVQQQADEAEALAKQLAGEQSSAQQATGNPEQGNGTHVDEVHAKPSEDYEQKYRTLQGIFNKQTSELRQQLADQAAQMKQLQEQLTEAHRAAEEQNAAVFGTDEDRANFGSDFVELVERGVDARTAEYRKEIASLKAQLADMGSTLNRVGQDAEVSRHAAFLADLDTLVPGWKEQNNDPAFLEWLRDVDPVSGMVRQDLLSRYEAERNSRQVDNIFSAFIGKTSKQSQPKLAQQVSPSRGHSGAAPQSKPVYTESQIAGFYDAWRRGMYTDEQGKALEKDIELAYAEGRIR